MSDKVVVGVLRRGAASRAELKELERLFPDCEFVFHRLDPKDYHEHAMLCEELKLDLVLLPLERPIPSVAMEEGFAHVALVPGKGLMELLPLRPKFKKFGVLKKAKRTVKGSKPVKKKCLHLRTEDPEPIEGDGRQYRRCLDCQEYWDI